MKFTVPGLPCSKNAAYDQRHGSGGLVLTAKAKEFMTRVQAAAVTAFGHHRPVFLGGGIVIITEAHFTKDADAGAVSALVQDALQGIAYTNDSQVLFAGGWKGDPDPENPRTEVSVDQLVIGSTNLSLDVPAHAWRSMLEENGAEMRKLADALTPGRRAKRALRPSVKDYGT